MERSMSRQHDKARAFRQLHERPGAFVIPNPWDAGFARLLAHVGFEALATTSAGYAFSVGKTDYAIERDEMMTHVAAVVAATDLPVSGDLGNGFGHEPQAVAHCIRLAAEAGLVGASIEDATLDPNAPIYCREHAVARIRAAVEAARALPFPFTVTARAENYLWGRPSLEDTIDRLRAYQDAGADVLYAPGPTTEREISEIVAALERPVNILAGISGFTLSVHQLASIGVKRISLGSALARTAFSAMLAAGREVREAGTFTIANKATSFRDMSSILR
jgi:2-methylisocitrate lyase-like PEP mutase family enzyme